MSKEYDFSDFEESKYDFSDFDEKQESRQPQAIASQPTELDSALLGAEQGLTFGFADEAKGALQAPMGAGKRLLELLGADYSKDADKIAYEQARDAARKEYEQAEVVNPKSYVAGNVGGSIIPAFLTAGASTAASTAGVGARLTNAAKIGAGSGAVVGAGMSDAEGLPDLITDTAKSAAFGGLTGGAMQGAGEAAKGIVKGVKHIGKEIADTKLGKNVADAYKFGKQDINLTSTEGLEQANRALVSAAEDIGMSARDVNREAGRLLGEARKQFAKEGKTFDLTDEVNAVEETIKKLLKSDNPDAIDDVAFLKKYLDNLKLGKEVTEEVQHSVFTPQKIIKGKKGTQELLEEQAAKAKEQARLLGQDVDVQIVPGEQNGVKLKSLLRTSDENIGSGERLVQNMVDDVSDSQVTKVRKSLENSPENKKKLEELVTKLKAKAKLEGKDLQYELVDDLDSGMYHVVEKGVKPTTQKVPGDVELSVDPTQNFKSTASAKTMLDVPSQPDVVIPAQRGPVVSEPLTYRAGGTDLSKVGFDKARDIQTTLTDFGGIATGSPRLKTQEAINTVRTSAGKIKGAIDEASDLAVPTQKSQSSFQAMETLKLDPTDFVTDPITKQVRLTTDAKNRLTNMVRQTGSEGQASITSTERIEDALRLLGQASPETAEALRPIVEQAARRVNLAQQAQGIGLLSRTEIVKKGSVQAANRVGRMVSSLAKSTPQSLKSMAAAMKSAGGAASKVGNVIDQIADKDEVGRNALLFSLQQQPEYRDVLKEWLGD